MTKLRRVFRLPTTASRLRDDVEAELRFHIDGRIDELEARGMARSEAEAMALHWFGDYEEYRRQAQFIGDDTLIRRRRMDFLDALGRETRQAARSLVHSPSFSAIALVTLALGIGATTAIFAVLDAVALRLLRYPRAEQLVSILHPVSGTGVETSKWGISSVGYFYFRRASRSFLDMGAYVTDYANVTGNGDPERVRTGMVTSSLFSTLGARAEVGRLVTLADDRPGAPQVVVLGYDFWTRRYGGDRRIVGRTIDVESTPMEVVGVVSRGFNLPSAGPFASAADLLDSRPISGGRSSSTPTGRR